MNEEEQNKKIKAFENTDKVLHRVVPTKPTDLSDDDLEQVVGGDSIDDGAEGG